MFRILPSGKLDKCVKELRPRHKEKVKYSGGPKILFGLEVPHNVREALEQDRRNENLMYSFV